MGDAESECSRANCEGCNLECSKNVKLFSFAGVSDIKMAL